MISMPQYKKLKTEKQNKTQFTVCINVYRYLYVSTDMMSKACFLFFYTA